MNQEIKHMDLNEKIAICFTCCGPTYRQTAYEKLENYYFDNDNIYYCILTDDRNYFNGLKRKNLIVNELKDFYERFPKLEKNEAFLESTDKEDYAKKFLEINWTFPFSVYRFHFLQAINLGITNVMMLCTDTDFTYKNFSNDILVQKNRIYNAVSQWKKTIKEQNMEVVVNRLESKYNFKINDEYILAPIYDALGITKYDGTYSRGDLFVANHQQKIERFWRC